MSLFFYSPRLPLQGGMLDREAYARGTTVYLQDRRLDMLPALLSEQLCSLRSGADRLAVSVLWTLGSDLNVQEVWCGHSIIRWGTPDRDQLRRVPAMALAVPHCWVCGTRRQCCICLVAI